jgi:DNA-directed RNA polymerase subunit RPC12/RpoP
MTDEFDWDAPENQAVECSYCGAINISDIIADDGIKCSYCLDGKRFTK